MRGGHAAESGPEPVIGEGVLDTDTEETHRGRGHVTTEAETGEMRPQHQVRLRRGRRSGPRRVSVYEVSPGPTGQSGVGEGPGLRASICPPAWLSCTAPPGWLKTRTFARPTKAMATGVRAKPHQGAGEHTGRAPVSPCGSPPPPTPPLSQEGHRGPALGATQPRTRNSWLQLGPPVGGTCLCGCTSWLETHSPDASRPAVGEPAKETRAPTPSQPRGSVTDLRGSCPGCGS